MIKFRRSIYQNGAQEIMISDFLKKTTEKSFEVIEVQKFKRKVLKMLNFEDINVKA